MFRSTQAGSGRISPEGIGSITGDFTVERWINDAENVTDDPNVSGIWRLIGSPVLDNLVDDGGLLSNIWTQGFPGSNDAEAAPNVFRYNEGVLFDEGQSARGWEVAGSGAFAVPGFGHLVYMFTFDDPFAPAGERGGWPKTLSVTGEFNSYENDASEVAVLPLTSEGNGFNLVANPFVSAFDFDDENHEFNNIDQVYYTYAGDGTPQSYSSGIGSPGNALTNVIPAFQGFFMVTDGIGGGGGAEARLSPLGKVDGGPNTLQKVAATAGNSLQEVAGSANSTDGVASGAPSTPNVLRLKVSDADGLASDEMLMRFSDRGDTGKTPFDAYQLQSLAQSYHQIGAVKPAYEAVLSILDLPFPVDASRSGANGSGNADGGTGYTGGPNHTMEIGLDIRSNITGKLQLSIPETLPDGLHFALLDRRDGTITDLEQGEIVDIWVDMDGDAEGHAKSIAASTDGPVGAGTGPAALAAIPVTVASASTDEPTGYALLVSQNPVNTEHTPDLPESLTLAQNYPNPFNPATQIEYSVPEASHVRLTVYDMLGREIAVLVDQNREPGSYQVSFDASALSSGVYLYRLESAGQTLTRKMTLVK